MYLIEKAYAAGYLMLQEGNQKYGTAVRRAMAILTTCLFVLNQAETNPVFATAAGTAKDKRLVDTIKMVLGMVYVIMVVVGVFLLVTNIMAYATADKSNIWYCWWRSARNATCYFNNVPICRVGRRSNQRLRWS